MRSIYAALIACSLCCSLTPVEAEDPDFYVITLGTGIPLPNPERGTAATLVVAGDKTVLVDTGRRCMERLVAAGFQSPSIILFTHFHSDHVAGFGELMTNRGIAGVDVPQRILGPKGTRGLVDDFLNAYRRDTGYRIAHHGEHWPANAMRADVTEAREPGVILDEEGLRVIMFNVDHEPIEPAVGYRIEFGGKSIVVSGDTKAIPEMVEAARGADVLVHEAMYVAQLNQARRLLQRGDPRRAAMLDDMMSHHAGTLDVAAIAREAGVKQLVLTHLVPSIPPTDAAEKIFTTGMSDIYTGPIVVARDGMKIVP
jgi:ribonuclease Z